MPLKDLSSASDLPPGDHGVSQSTFVLPKPGRALGFAAVGGATEASLQRATTATIRQGQKQASVPSSFQFASRAMP